MPLYFSLESMQYSNESHNKHRNRVRRERKKKMVGFGYFPHLAYAVFFLHFFFMLPVVHILLRFQYSIFFFSSSRYWNYTTCTNHRRLSFIHKHPQINAHTASIHTKRITIHSHTYTHVALHAYVGTSLGSRRTDRHVGVCVCECVCVFRCVCT